MSGIHFNQQDLYVLDRLCEVVKEHRANGGAPLDLNDCAELAAKIRAQFFGLPDGCVAVPAEDLRWLLNSFDAAGSPPRAARWNRLDALAKSKEEAS